MTTAQGMTGATPVRKESPPSNTVWIVAALVALAAVAVVLGALWLVERNDVSGLETDLDTATAAQVASEAQVATLETEITTLETEAAALNAQVAELEAQVATLDAATTLSDPMQAPTQELYDEFLAAIQDPDAETISAMFAPYATHTSASGVTMRGAEEIGAGWEAYGPLDVTDTDMLFINGAEDGTWVAAMTGTVGLTDDGFLVAKVGPYEGELVFWDMLWYDG